MDLPRKLGPYRLVERIGRGGMAEVFLARAFGASGFEKQVAIKTVRPELQGDGALERILIDEARLAAGLSHRNLVGVHDLGVDAGVYYVRMDYLDAGDLGAALARALPGPALALHLVGEIAQALAYLHRATDDQGRSLGLVHRDVSPQNVLLSRAGEVKLADLGIAKATLAVDPNQSYVRKGKLGYMSPEQVAGVPVTARSDLFSLGVTLYELLVGRTPFQGGSPVQTLERLRAAELPPLERLDAPLAAVLRRMLARRPEDRFESAEDLLEALRGAARELPEPGPDALRRWLGRADR